MIPITNIIDIGNMVLCDSCNDDYTNSETQGGILVGSYAICPECARDFHESEDEPVIHCPAGVRFRDWVLGLRGGRNTIEITSY
jgi:hypothetical protein